MDSRGFESINVIPFIDIMLVLLTIVLMTSTFIVSGAIGVKLPEASPSPTPLQKSLHVEIDREGRIYFEGGPVALEQLASYLSVRDRSVPVLIRADRQLPLQGFVDVMDTVKVLGFTKVSLQTETSK